ncbi:MAG: iron-containing alcohol dehydrogenase [Verrucomicrobia bacterium]|nr:iron-containing alcohol dehydrogenase [Verrucomicrobiota bacterium]
MVTSASPFHFEFATATRIIFGAGKLREIGPLAKEFGQRALVVTGRRPERAARLLGLLKSQSVASLTFAVPCEPTTELVAEGVRRAREAGCDLVIGFGGGSALDAAKAIAALLTNPGELLDYLEVVGQAKPLRQPGAPFLAIPTTAGTGTEVTRNAVLASPAHKVKVSLRSPLLLAKLALIDPELTYDLPLAITASTGLDAHTQIIEPFVCNRANPLTDALCREGMRRAARSLRVACEAAASARAAEGLSARHIAARQDMAVASLFSGLALANAGLGAVHGFAAPIGGMFPAPHGAVCAALLPHVMAANLEALRCRAPDSDALRRYEEVARILTGDPAARAADGVAWISTLSSDLRIPSLGAYQVTRADLPALVERAAQASSMKANPIALTPEELHGILEAAL